jgi:sirohydrochlorin cobaltochelatase
MQTEAWLFVGHGSRDPEGTAEFTRLVDKVRQAEPGRIVEHGFLEYAKPILEDAFARCDEREAKTITVLPGMLMAAGHAKNDIPSEIHEARRRYPHIAFHYGRHLHLHSKIIELSRLRLEEAEHKAPALPRSDTLLLAVGRGSSDPDANADVGKLARILWEGMGYGWAAAAYIGVTTPLLPEALERCRRMGFARIIVFPFFLFTGILEKRIRSITREFAGMHKETEFLCAPYLNVHPLLMEVFAERAHEAVHGQPHMNCELCKYRVQLPGFEAGVGQPQVGHHHHVRGIGQEVGHHHHHHDDKHHHH